MWDEDIKTETNWNHMRTWGALEIGQWPWRRWRRVSFQSISDHSHNFEAVTVVFQITEVPKLVFFLSGFARSRVTILWKSHSAYFSFWYFNWILCGFDNRALRNVSVLFPSWLSEPNEPKGEEYQPHADRVAKTCAAERVLWYQCAGCLLNSIGLWSWKIFFHLLRFDPVYKILYSVCLPYFK